MSRGSVETKLHLLYLWLQMLLSMLSLVKISVYKV